MVDFSKEIIKEEKKLEKSVRNLNSWMIVSCVLAVLLVIAIAMVFWPSGLSEKAASEKLLLTLGGMVTEPVTLINTTNLGGLYEVSVLYQGQTIPVYITKDGKYKAMGVQEIKSTDSANPSNPNTQTPSAPTPTEVTKSDKPKVELFVMTECPYGTQSEKGIIPAFEALGTSADTQIRFVHYFMHGDKEEKETYTQICIREEQSTKFMAYLKCYLVDGDSARCIKNASIDSAKLTTCIATNAKAYYKVDSDLSNKYGVQGSPTLIINGAESNAGRNSASYLAGICSAFNNAPSACTKTLSSTNPSAGFGYGAAGSASAASCG